jgi:hypothetical protein
MAKQDQQEWRYVFSIRGDLANPGDATLTGPFEDTEAADEYVEDFTKLDISTETTTHIVAALVDSDDVLAALKKAKKKAKKQAKKADKKQKSVAETINGNGEKKNKKGKKDEQDAPSDGEEGVTPEPVAEVNEQQAKEEERRRQLSARAAKQPWAGKLSDNKDQLIDQWAKEFSQHSAIGPLNLSPQQRRVLGALKWEQQVSFANAHMPSTTIQPPFFVGMDANGRPVVQQFRADHPSENGKPHQWSLFKNGNPTDVKEPVTRLKAKAAESA